jgi:nucleotide-binding universal stress UspA family protein
VTEIWAQAALWLALALIATLAAIRLRIATAANLIDHIVVGHRGHTLFERCLIGSVARQVIAYAHCAVIVVRDYLP